MGEINWQLNRHKSPHPSAFSVVNKEEIRKAMRFHQTVPDYAPTPLHSLSSLANELGIQRIFVKDESYRFDLNSFKVLGSSYALATYLARTLQTDVNSFSIIKEKVKSLPVHTFATATDGNHGRGLAWSAKMLGQRSVVYMPKGASAYRLQMIRDLGAQADITNNDYDDTVRFVSQLAEQQGWTLVQDTAWEGYTDIPTLIMQGYLTIIGEFLEQFTAMEKKGLTHVILQAGVGSFAGAMAGALQQLTKTPIKFIIVEPNQADCFYQSARTEDGSSKAASGNLSTIMAGLSCGETNPISWDILKNIADCFVSCPDRVAASGMRILGNPLHTDPRIVSGESGAVPLGLLFELCRNPLLAELKKLLALDSSSRVLVINTEGDTDPENYRKVCWDGMYSNNRE
ncbi:diaminopropionate ammonia-lyase [Aneurinibacillus migulanus]|uniref:Diaminopropionate ammonia-lyase n=1 Tax=Aneurinibacillus migulanus TaxID=47500 RepID=A0A0D1YL04_ANEMI|nr:diaminopropionate ammonia-lyase [Aneurinibacillus migulanus]KIV59437.1 diaminopropionate ammonia-lyase [Aneurinibacillus migulanus]KON97196.1 diaminopropionate ammonia-lyase [Aneurinibacillus migulanus]MED0894355.1 diaminopropionate ammonia-lyase [Aneurinibacillus migulanus]MED1616439.1 diaminopropionate ammonia-lyase [Aneurinibacillus migulanus]SDK20260.1 diaminopropionate ammonia-lyase [Aneurinibacillus migulanus]